MQLHKLPAVNSNSSICHQLFKFMNASKASIAPRHCAICFEEAYLHQEGLLHTTNTNEQDGGVQQGKRKGVECFSSCP